MRAGVAPPPGLAPGSAAAEIAALRAAFRPPTYLVPLIFIAYSCLLPRELTFNLGGIAMGPTRTVAVLCTPLLFYLLKNKPVKTSALDALAGVVCAWYTLASYAVDGFPTAITSGVATSIDAALIYVIARVGIRTHQDLQQLLLVLLPGVTAAGLLMFVESVTHTPILRPLVAGLLGVPTFADTTPRFGLMRGIGPFSHPILAGAFVAALLPPFWGAFGNLPRLRIIAVGTGLLAFFSLSSAAILGLLIGIGLIVAVVMQRWLRVPLLLIGSVLLVPVVLGLQFGTQNGALSVFLRYATLNTSSAIYRTAIWEHGSIEVANNPLFGIGVRDWIRPIWMVHDTVDAYWLLLSMRYGLPASVCTLLLTIGAAVSVGRTAALLPKSPARDLNIGLAVSLFMVIFIGFTVHLWENMLVLLLLLIASAIGLGQASLRSIAQPAPPAPMRRNRSSAGIPGYGSANMGARANR